MTAGPATASTGAAPSAHQSVRIADRVRLDGTDPDALSQVRALREAAALATTVDWAVDLPPGLPVWTLTHLPPPREATGLTPVELQEWRHRYRYGLCYYRRGPDFVVVHDDRREPATRRVVTDQAAVEALATLRLPQLPDVLPPAVRAVLPALHRHGLILRLGGQVLTLPWRPTRWPVPCTL
ncbi:hypothetical protein GCM10022251_34960 [Phytohabitans flavus]|uniref:Uncharacterized protein n=1 Tax=Phytohabitans flavus TaxID=1076124 RepID=A0A6F8XMW9_9ACTN|nr:DUF5825 family protein [Phytohabitans flavus]BCB75147.1 hypothetical protein Pflav_015570 [Phytohabitans flavus]